MLDKRLNLTWQSACMSTFPNIKTSKDPPRCFFPHPQQVSLNQLTSSTLRLNFNFSVSNPTTFKMMFNKVSSIAFLAFIGAAYAQRKCGAPAPTEELVDAAVEDTKAQLAALKANGGVSTFAAAAQATIQVDTWFHVLRSGTTEAQGNIPQSKLDQQVNYFFLYSRYKIY